MYVIAYKYPNITSLLQINTVLLEEKKQRDNEVLERMEFIKTLRSNSVDIPPPVQLKVSMTTIL